MTFKTTAATLILVTLAFVCLIARGSTTNQPPQSAIESSSDRQILIEILSELRKLNKSVKQANAFSNKTQIAISLVQAQQNQVDRVNRQLQSVRAEIESGESQKTEMEERLKLLSSQLDSESDLMRHSQFEDELRALKALVASHGQHQQHLRDEDTRLANLLQLEQAKLESLASQLALLEHVLETQ